jgi:hypothetical protein
MLRDACYAVLSFPAGLLWFLVTVISLVLGWVLALTVIGIPVLLAGLALIRKGADTERARARLMLGSATPPPARQVSRGGPFRRVRARGGDRQTWRDVGYHLLSLLFGFAGVLVLVGGIALIARAAVWPFLAWGHPSFYRQAWGGPTLAGAMAVHCIPGLLALLFGPWVLRRVVRLQETAVRRLLSGLR